MCLDGDEDVAGVVEARNLRYGYFSGLSQWSHGVVRGF